MLKNLCRLQKCIEILEKNVLGSEIIAFEMVARKSPYNNQNTSKGLLKQDLLDI